MNRETLMNEAIERCMKELYSYAQPSVDWDDFLEQNKVYSEKYRQWESFNMAKNRAHENPDNWEKQKNLHPDWVDKKLHECIGSRPYEFYYLPEDAMRTICDSYVSAYKFDNQKNLEEIKDILIHYCNEPIINKRVYGLDDYVHNGYDRPQSLESALKELIGNDELGTKAWNKMVEYLNMATNFYSWNRELNGFNGNVYLGASPTSNKNTVINAWKKERGLDIEIDDNKYKNFHDKYYGWYEEEDYDEEDNAE